MAAEFNADSVIAENPHYKDALMRELSKPTAKISWRRRFFFRLSHPPNSLRRFFLRRRDSMAYVLLLLIFPLAVLVKIALTHVWAFLIESSIGAGDAIAGQASSFTWHEFLATFIERTQDAPASAPWLLMTGLLLIWTIAVRPWERFFLRGREAMLLVDGNDLTAAPSKSRFKFFALAAALTGTVFLLVSV